MLRYFDLHYQYLTSSYACMLSCPISLRPFVILEGTGLGPRVTQGQTKGGCHQHPCGGCDLPSLQYSLLFCSFCFVQQWFLCLSVEKLLSSKINSSVECGFHVVHNENCRSRYVASDHLKMAVCLHSLRVRKYVFDRSVNAYNKSAFGFHLLRITLWMSLCGYTFLFLSL